ncbi:MAG: VWA domain-containing protein [Planctomycetes bacterium]|nr:VWA domain-containing protein [Planctomycetota bacterium]
MDRVGLRRQRTSWDSWIVSAVLHAVGVILLGICSLPRDLGSGGPLDLAAELDAQEAPLETLELIAGGLAPDVVALPSVDELELTDLATLDPQTDPFGADAAHGAGRAPQSASSNRQGQTEGQSGRQASFFGTSAYGDRFVYVLDMSGSMQQTGRGARYGNRFQRASSELVRSVNQLTDNQAFSVILFSSKTRLMFDHDGLFPEMLPATSENKERLRDWLATISPDGGTDPREALRLGLELAPSAVFLLSDGDFKPEENSGNLLTSSLTIPEVVDRSNHARAPIHTIAYEDLSNRVSMQALAAQTAGQYRFVPAGAVIVEETPVPLSPEDLAVKANRLLSQIKRVESRGFHRQAAQRYRKLVNDFPDTPAAQEADVRARELLAQLNSDSSRVLKGSKSPGDIKQNVRRGK